MCQLKSFAMKNNLLDKQFQVIKNNNKKQLRNKSF